MAKRRLTGASRRDVAVHLLRESKLVEQQARALKAAREYLVECWLKWARDAKALGVKAGLPKTCFKVNPHPRPMSMHNFYNELGSYEYAHDHTDEDIRSQGFLRGTEASLYHPRMMSPEQVKELKKLGKAWDSCKDEARSFQNDVESVLASNTTVEGLIEDLPACEPFAKQFLNPKRDQQTSLVVPGAHRRIRKQLKDGGEDARCVN